MKHRLLVAFSIIVVIVGIVSAVLSVAMLISAVRFSEWGRVVFYSVDIAICIEMIVLSIEKIKTTEPS